MKKTISFLSLILMLFSCSIKKKNDNVALQSAVYDYRRGDYAGCRKKLEDYTRQFPDDYQGWSFLGTVALELENDSLAHFALKKAISINSNDFKGLTGLGIVERRKKNLQKASEYYNKAIAINPEYAKAYSSLLVVELKRGNFIRAVELGEKAVTLDANDLGAKGNLSLAYHFSKQYRKRDSLINEITLKGYQDVEYLKLFFNDFVTLDDL